MTCTYCNKYKAIYQPQTNCTVCWNLYFEKRRMAFHWAWKNLGKEVLTKKYGTKLVKHLERWVNIGTDY